MPQRNKLHLLFVCTANVQRSPTAEDLFYGSEQIEAKSAGIHPLAMKRINQSMIDWADKIFVMNESRDRHLTFLEEHFDLSGKEVYDLDIPDIYERDNPHLIEILKEKLEKYL